ncbi:hypothetical protein CRUP_006000 [Coryphaenoides rupestris]|nr:hypothetical protein CRUP_006000 [Coryphaenoides rupestris]
MTSRLVYSERDFRSDVVRAAGSRRAEEVEPSAFDALLTSGWRDRMRRGDVFRFRVDELRTRRIAGPRSYLAQLNVGRGAERRKPQEILSLDQPYDHRLFNFNTLVGSDEVLFEMSRDHRGSAGEGEGGGGGLGSQMSRDGSSDGEGGGGGLGSQMSRDGGSDGEGDGGGLGSQRGVVLVVVNVSPLEFGHCLLVPEPSRCLPQVLTPLAVRTGIEAVLLSSDPGFRVGFNSLGGFASVNHLHLHGYYLDHELLLETVPVLPLVPQKGFYRLTQRLMPRGFLFYTEPGDLDQVARVLYQVTDTLVRGGVAHNLFVTRGCPPNHEGDDTQGPSAGRRGVRIALWPRRSSFGTKEETAFNVALCELAGHVPFKLRPDYETMTEEDVIEVIQRHLLPEEDIIRLEKQLVADMIDL